MARQPVEAQPTKATSKRLRISQMKSGIGFAANQRAVLAGLGLSRPGSVVVREDSPSIRGMCFKIRHLVVVEEIAE